MQALAARTRQILLAAHFTLGCGPSARYQRVASKYSLRDLLKMIIIRRVEIKYFRSIYDVTLKECDSLNIFSGRNDVGKSNILRALNLFFNGQTDWRSPLDFGADFSLHRMEQVRKESVKGKQFIQIAIDFSRPDNFKGSLPARFTVKRSWYRDRQFAQTDNLAALQKAGKCPSSLSSAQMMLPKFLNRVHFEYVPAVKDRAFFDHLLARLQYSLLGRQLEAESPISHLADQLAQHIGEQVGNLRDDFSRATNLDTSIEPPRELAGLFQAFQVSVPSGENQIALRLHGDGMQARYIPSVLHYIASKSPSFFVWGFEEPENSLEFSASDSLGEDLQERYSKDAQIFVTSHSPTMISRKGPRVACFRVWQPGGKSQVERLTYPLSSSNAGAALEEEIGLVRIQNEIHEDYKDRLQLLGQQTATIRDLEAELKNHQLPLALFEGPTDVLIIREAWKKLYGEAAMPFHARSADPLENIQGTSGGGANALQRAIESIHPADKRRVLAIFDYDQEGAKAFQGLSKNFKPVGSSEHERRHVNGYSFALTLAAAAPGLPTVPLKSLCTELLFDSDVLDLKDDAGHGLTFRAPDISIIVGDRRFEITPSQSDLFRQSLGDLTAFRVILGGKMAFATNIVPTLPEVKFSRFSGLFQKICETLGV